MRGKECDHLMNHREISVEVCQGPDCAGLGGGAAILEIEEIVQEAVHVYERHAHRPQQALRNVRRIPPQVIVGGCRNFCTVGPNVHLLDAIEGGTLESFHQVNSPSSCAIVSQRAILAAGMDSTSSNNGNDDAGGNTNATQSMMLRRSERLRWEALRTISRTITKLKKDDMNGVEQTQAKLDRLGESCAKQLSSASRAEVSAMSRVGDEEAALASARGKRRAERLMHLMRDGLRESIVESEDESSHNEGSFVSSHSAL